MYSQTDGRTDRHFNLGGGLGNLGTVPPGNSLGPQAIKPAAKIGTPEN